MPFILGANSVSGYTVKNSLRFNAGSSDNLTRTPASAGNRQKSTFSFWFKRSNLGINYMPIFNFGSSAIDDFIGFTSLEALRIWFNGGSNGDINPSQLFRDVSAWYHIVVAIDTTQATGSDRVKIYVNGSQITAFASATYPTQNSNLNINNTIIQRIGYAIDLNYLAGYLSEIYNIDGQQLTPSSFGETDTDTGIWKPKAYTGTYGTNGFYLKLANSASLGTDSSGNGNTFTVNNLTSIDQTTDTPTNNFCIGNPLDNNACVFTEGNLKVAGDGSNGWNVSRSTFGLSTGKWYWEVKPTSITSQVLGISVSTQNAPLNALVGQNNNFGVTYYPDGLKFLESSGSGVSYGASYTTSDIIGVALDMDNGTVTFYKNGTTQGVASTSLKTYGDTWFPTFCAFYPNDAQIYNFGNPPYSANSYTDSAGFGNFSYSVPSGFFSLNTKNLAQYG
jgi:hypothetical protein